MTLLIIFAKQTKEIVLYSQAPSMEECKVAAVVVMQQYQDVVAGCFTAI